jgi:hypothetical protein
MKRGAYPIPEELQAACDEIYAAYPRKAAPRYSKWCVYRKMVHQPYTADFLLEKVRLYAKCVKEWPKTRRFTRDGTDTVPHLSTWINQDRFEEDVTEWVDRPSQAIPRVAGTRFKDAF